MRGSAMLQNIEFLPRRAFELPTEFPDTFDKVVCHVPSTDDRYTLHRNEDNVFNPKSKRERLRLPETQGCNSSNRRPQTCPLPCFEI